MDTSPYCGHPSIMNAICILWTPLHAYYGHLATINAICILSTPLHTVDTSPLWMQYAYYGHLSILWIPLHYEHNMHTIDTSAFFRHILWTPLHTSHYYTHLCINYGHPCIPRKPMHNMDPSASTDTSAYYSLHLCIHVPWTAMHNNYRHLYILKTAITDSSLGPYYRHLGHFGVCILKRGLTALSYTF